MADGLQHGHTGKCGEIVICLTAKILTVQYRACKATASQGDSNASNRNANSGLYGRRLHSRQGPAA